MRGRNWSLVLGSLALLILGMVGLLTDWPTDLLIERCLGSAMVGALVGQGISRLLHSAAGVAQSAASHSGQLLDLTIPEVGPRAGGGGGEGPKGQEAFTPVDLAKAARVVKQMGEEI